MTLFTSTLLSRLFSGSIGLVAIAYSSICLFLYAWQTRMIFFPSAQITATPADFGTPFQDVWFPVATSKGTVQLHGWWLPGQGEQTVLYLHGNGFNVGANAAHASRFNQMGFSVLVFDYRGYGLSEGGFPTEAKVYQDAQAAMNYLVQQRHIDPEDLLIYGHSLGGAIAIELASHHPEVAGLIVESSFTSMRDMVDHAKNLNLFPIDWILTQQFASIDKVSSLSMPVLFIHGLADDKVPPTMSEELYTATPDPKRIWLVPGATHNDVAELTGSEYFQTVQQFVDRVLPLRH